jgi:predicted DsbA family dithiol-disulfide isomerase
VIVLFGDVGCPWASLAVHRLRRRRHERRLDELVRLDHRAFPLELFNAQVTPKTIVDSEVAVVGAHEPDLGWQPWQRHEREFPSTTLLPLEAVQAAKAAEVGGLRASEDLDAALRHAWYAESRSIHLWSELFAIAAELPSVDAPALEHALRRGAGRAEVFAQWEQASRVAQGSPHLYLTDGLSVHNPGITLEWTDHQFAGMPRIAADDVAVYDTLLDRAGRLSSG